MNIMKSSKVNYFFHDIHKIILIILVVFNSIIWSSLYVLRYQTFGLHTDTGSYEQTIWNTLHGNMFESSLAISVFSFNSIRSNPLFELPQEIIPFIFSTIHTNVIALVFSPIYFLAPFTETLLITSMVLLSLGAIPLYLISNHILKNKNLSLIIVISYFLNPALFAASLADFNYLTFAIPLLFFAFYFMLKSKWIFYWICIGLLLTIREELGLIIFFLGLYIVIFQKSKLVGLITSLVGIIVFAVTVFYIFPEFIKIELFTGNFSVVGQGEGIKGIPKTILTNPSIIVEHIYNSNAWLYLIQIFSHTGFLSILNPASFLISFPELMKNLLTNNDVPFRLMWNHYQLLVIPGLYLSTIFSIKTLIKRINKRKQLAILIISIILLSSALISNSLFSAAPLKKIDLTITNEGEIKEGRFVWWEFLNPFCCFDYTVNNQRMYYSDQLISVEKALSLIPPDASVSSQDEFVNHLSRRAELYLFPILYDKVDYVLVMSEATGMFGTGYVPQEMQEKYISKLKNDGNHKIIFNENGLLLFKKNS